MSAKTRNYDPMSEDGYDSKIPLYNDEVFQHGIHFNAKVITSDSNWEFSNDYFSLLVRWKYRNQPVEWKLLLQCVEFAYVELYQIDCD